MAQTKTALDVIEECEKAVGLVENALMGACKLDHEHNVFVADLILHLQHDLWEMRENLVAEDAAGTALVMKINAVLKASGFGSEGNEKVRLK